MSSSWKVAFADFMTAMMAFFLLMWLLNVTDEETKAGLAGYFTPGANMQTNITSPIGEANNPILQYVDKLDNRSRVTEIEKSQFAIVEAIREYLMQDAKTSASSGITSDGVGVLLHITADLMFEPGTTEFTASGKQALDEVVKVMNKYKVLLIVRGHADSTESLEGYPSAWELSAARASAAVRYLISKGISPSAMRSVAYADTNPKVPPTIPDAARQNSRVEFYFHRPEVKSTVVGY